jgi:hypothetical protein
MKCLICNCGDDGRGLVYIQEHVMYMHDYTVDDLRSCTKREIENGYIYTMADGIDWLQAEREANA